MSMSVGNIHLISSKVYATEGAREAIMSSISHHTPGDLSIKLQDENNVIRALSIDSSGTVFDIKEKIDLELGIFPMKYDLFFENTILDDQKNVQSYQLTPESVLVMKPKQETALISPSNSYNYMSYFSPTKVGAIGYRFPENSQESFYQRLKGKTIKKGLNFEGICKNQMCTLFKKHVWIHKGIGRFEIGKEIFNSQCPECLTNASEIDKMGFWNCRVVITGLQTEPQMEGLNFNKIIEQEEFIIFKNDNASKWSYISVNVEGTDKNSFIFFRCNVL